MIIIQGLVGEGKKVDVREILLGLTGQVLKSRMRVSRLPKHSHPNTVRVSANMEVFDLKSGSLSYVAGDVWIGILAD